MPTQIVALREEAQAFNQSGNQSPEKCADSGRAQMGLYQTLHRVQAPRAHEPHCEEKPLTTGKRFGPSPSSQALAFTARDKIILRLAGICCSIVEQG